jgi:hypothetical protein
VASIELAGAHVATKVASRITARQSAPTRSNEENGNEGDECGRAAFGDDDGDDLGASESVQRGQDGEDDRRRPGTQGQRRRPAEEPIAGLSDGARQ